MFQLLGFGVSSSRPHVPGHPTFICNESVNDRLKLEWFQDLGMFLYKTLQCTFDFIF